MRISKLALVASLALGGSAVLFTDSAEAQRAPRGAQQPAVQAQGRTLNLTAEERAVLVPLDAAARGTDRAAQDAALAAAQPVVRGPDARYAFARYQMTIALQREDNQMLARAVDMAVESGAAPPDELPTYLSSQAQAAVQARDFAKAERALAQLAQLRPGDVNLQAQLGQVQISQGNGAAGLRTLQSAIAAQQAAGQAVPESWHRFALRAAYESRDPAVRTQATGLARTLVTAHPTPTNWRDALLIYRETGNPDSTTQLDLWRLMLAAGALAGERDYYDFAHTLNQGGYPAEAKAVLDAGISSRMVDASRSPFRELLQAASGRVAMDLAELPNAQRAALAAASGTPALRTADAFLGHGRYPEAIALYQAALQKGGVDANLVNMRLGIAHARAGQRAEAEAAFRAVTGPRADLASYWLLWLGQGGR